MWAQFAVSLDYATNIGNHVNRWVNDHLLNIIIILVGCHILRILTNRVLNAIVKRTIRHDLFPTEPERKKRITTLSSLISVTTRIGAWVLAIIMIISELGINTGPLLASAGFLGVAIGFGAQSLIKDFVSGIFIISENQYRIGDIVEINNVSGIVEAITTRTTVLRDIDGGVHHVPNGTITVTTNNTSHYSRVDETIIVAPDTNIDQLEHLINHVGEELVAKPGYKDKILDPPKFFRIQGFENGGIRVQILATVTEGEQWQIKSDFYRLLIKSLKQHDITVLSNQQVTIHKSK